MTFLNTTPSCWRGPTIALIASPSTPVSRWDRPAAASAAGGDSSTATTRNWMTSICARWQGHSPAACMRSAASKGFQSSRHDPASESMNWLRRTCPRIGLFLVITGNAPAPTWEVKRNAAGQITEIRHRKNWPYVKHYYFHIIDREWGHVTVRMCGYPPFGAQLILNGHEWVEREARRKCLTAAKDGNCFVEGSDFDAVNRLA